MGYLLLKENTCCLLARYTLTKATPIAMI